MEVLELVGLCLFAGRMWRWGENLMNGDGYHQQLTCLGAKKVRIKGMYENKRQSILAASVFSYNQNEAWFQKATEAFLMRRGVRVQKGRE